MKVCFPVKEDNGMESRIYDHFGSAPIFIIVDVTSSSFSSVANGDRHHAHGFCNPIKALDNHEIDAVVVGGIGGGALRRLNQSGIRVFQPAAASVRENIEMFLAGQLPEYSPHQCCGGHAGGGCAH